MLPLPAKCSVNSLNICEQSIKTHLGSKILRDFRFSTIMLIDLLDQLKDFGITINIFADEKGLNYVLKDSKGKVLPGCQFYGTRDFKASVVLKTAIARAFYCVNKTLKSQIKIIN